MGKVVRDGLCKEGTSFWHLGPKYQNVCERQTMHSSVTKAKPQPSEMPNQTNQARDGGQGLDLVSESLATHAHQGFFFFFSLVGEGPKELLCKP